MTLSVYTARVTYAGQDRLDITRKSAGPDGLPFAPSWKILGPMLMHRREGGAIDPYFGWPQYVEDYRREMRAGYRLCPDDWNALLARDEVTLVCYCSDPTHCHRTLLAGFLGKLGATVRGERVVRPATERVFGLFAAVSDYEQTGDEAEAELRADGLDVDAFLDGVHAAVDKARGEL